MEPLEFSLLRGPSSQVSFAALFSSFLSRRKSDLFESGTKVFKLLSYYWMEKVKGELGPTNNMQQDKDSTHFRRLIYNLQSIVDAGFWTPCESRLLLKRSGALKMRLGRNRYWVFCVHERASNLFQPRNERWKVLCVGYIDFPERLPSTCMKIDCRCGLLEAPFQPPVKVFVKEIRGFEDGFGQE
ncbi:hypothetical protein CEXT_798601 [Caerostris extrusa]|uniref:Uncharacterized protein n=1 Tax=Caerostris extrusa TaxID=172846 RepID=A0AAV4Q2K7_CAEEX|nr:hypothetical protein CEXT_798601 [Caerostris extrusa]